MKHLRKFNESFEESIKKDIEDILIDFSDRHIPLLVKQTTVDRKTVCSIALGDEYADTDMISIIPRNNEDEFLRIFDYMRDNEYEFSSMSYDFNGSIIILKATDIKRTFGPGMDNISNQLFNGIDETCYLKLFFRKR